MLIIEPGHKYALRTLDGPLAFADELRFVKRVGEKYPGNVGPHPGTTCQEVLRAVVDRLSYADAQIPDRRTEMARLLAMFAITLLEERAADRHGREAPRMEDAVFGPCCARCGHVGCKGECHA